MESWIKSLFCSDLLADLEKAKKDMDDLKMRRQS